MILILFDIDGTLTATNVVDARCYAAAFGKTFGAGLPTTDWNGYVHCTDFAIADEALDQLRGRPTAPGERAAFERTFVAELEAAYAVSPGAFAEIPGAKALLDVLGRHSDFAPGIATGGMRGSATYKLSRIGVDAAALPAAFANDALTREAIIQCAAARANGGCTEVISVGDGPWDVRTAAALGLRFVGIVGDASPERLRAQGAAVCLNNFLDQDAFFRAVKEAAVPESSDNQRGMFP